MSKVTNRVVVISRYTGAHPDPDTICTGPCEGMGCYPIFDERGLRGEQRKKWEETGALCATDPNSASDQQAWETLHADAQDHECDGWHFFCCPACGGSGKRGAVAS